MEELIFLINVYSDLERGIATMASEDAGIPYSSEDYESGNYMRLFMGSSIYGYEIDVSPEDYDRAIEVIITASGPGIFEKQEK